MGCYVETGIDGVKKDDCVDLAVGNNKKSEIVDILNTFLEARGEYDDKTLGGNSIIDINHTNEYENMQLSEMPEHTRAYIKIQDGCNQFCSYCVIPYARGRVRSREMSEILTEIEGLVQKGCKEVVLTGIHIGSYGLDKGEPMLVDLVEKIADISGIDRIRLGSIEPRLRVEFYSNVITRQAVIETPELIYETIGIDDLYETKELAEKKRNELIEKKFYA